MKSSSTKVPNGHGSLYKEVRFSPTVTPIRRAQSVSTSNPSMNSDYVRARGRGLSVGESYCTLNATYLQQSQSLIERQRQSFEGERAIFAEERLLWERERALLRLRIEELETLLVARGGASAPSTSQSDAALSSKQNRSNGQNGEILNKPTRVFQGAENGSLLVPISEQGGSVSLSLDAALSPQSRPADTISAASVPVPIEKVDSKLDGITLKSSALPPEVVARVMTPPSPSPLDTSPSAPPRRPSSKRRNSLKLKLSDLGRPDMNLTRDAGHTPMAVIDAGADAEQPSGGGSPSPQAPAEMDPNRPRENSESYFPVLDVPDDPALKGPLSLLNDEDHDKGFLNELNQKLLDEARHIISKPSDPKEETDTDGEPPSQGEPEPELKFKNTTNFGTAFGKPNCGGPDL